MKLIVFDVDGTLIDSQNHIFSAMSDAFSQNGRAAPGRLEVLSIVGLSLPVAVSTLVPGVNEAERDLLVESYSHAFRNRRDREETPLFPGIAELLDLLAARDDVLLGIATGKSRRGLDIAIAHHRLPAFATLQTADQHPSKPHPAMLLSALAETGTAPGDAVMVGDTSFDAEMARAAGMVMIGVGWGYHPVDHLRAAGAERIAADAGELKRLLLEWL